MTVRCREGDEFSRYLNIGKRSSSWLLSWLMREPRESDRLRNIPGFLTGATKVMMMPSQGTQGTLGLFFFFNNEDYLFKLGIIYFLQKITCRNFKSFLKTLEAFTLLFSWLCGQGHNGQHSYKNKQQRHFPHLRLDLTSMSIGWTLSCLMDGEISMPVMLWCVIKPVNWQQFVLFTKSICSLKLICYLNLVTAEHARNRRWRGLCGESQFPTRWAGNLDSFLPALGVALHKQPQGTCYFAFPFCEMRAAAAVGYCAMGIHSMRAWCQQC